jgi:hypothetical protein
VEAAGKGKSGFESPSVALLWRYIWKSVKKVEWA